MSDYAEVKADIIAEQATANTILAEYAYFTKG